MNLSKKKKKNDTVSGMEVIGPFGKKLELELSPIDRYRLNGDKDLLRFSYYMD